MIAMGMVMFMLGLFSFVNESQAFFDASFMFWIYVFSSFCIVDIDCWMSWILFKYYFVSNYYCLWSKFGFKNFSYGVYFYGNDELSTFSLLKC